MWCPVTEMYPNNAVHWQWHCQNLIPNQPVYLNIRYIEIFQIFSFYLLSPYPCCILLFVKTVCWMLISFELLLLLFKTSLRWRDTCSIHHILVVFYFLSKLFAKCQFFLNFCFFCLKYLLDGETRVIFF